MPDADATAAADDDARAAPAPRLADGDADEAEAGASLEVRAKALASPLRWRILRLCLHEERTNRELATLLDRNPATMLHHVRTLVDAGYLVPGQARRGTRGAREIPYLASRLTWTEREKPAGSDVVVRTFLEEIEGLAQEEVDVGRVGLMLTDAERVALQRDIMRLAIEAAERPATGDEPREPWSIFVAVHPDRQQRAGGA